MKDYCSPTLIFHYPQVCHTCTILHIALGPPTQLPEFDFDPGVTRGGCQGGLMWERRRGGRCGRLIMHILYSSASLSTSNLSVCICELQVLLVFIMCYSLLMLLFFSEGYIENKCF